MKKFNLSVPALLVALSFSGAAAADSLATKGSVQHFGDSISHTGQSVTHSAKATGDALVGTTKLVSGVVALPIKGVGIGAGAVADASNAVGDFLWDNATGTTGEALEISDETVTAGPAPSVAMNVTY